MKKYISLKNVIILFNIIFILTLLLTPKVTLAKTCDEKYPGNGLCESDTKCTSEYTLDSSADLCPEKQVCCHQGTASTKLILQVPILDYAEASNATEYIAKIYESTLYIIIPFIIVVIIFSGLLWIFARGDKSIIAKAKSRIIHGFIGLGIALFSYILLSTVGISSISLSEVKHIEHEDDIDIPFTNMATGGGSFGGSASYPSVGGGCFPVAGNSFAKVSWNWGSPRKGGARCHAGVDIYTKPPGHVIGVANGGVVTKINHFITCSVKNRGAWGKHGNIPTSYVLIYYPSLEHTINHGEVDTKSLVVKVGDTVNAGQAIGVASGCGMMHMELYEGKTSSLAHWYPNTSVQRANGCAKNDLNKKPAKLKNPNDTIKALQAKMCGN